MATPVLLPCCPSDGGASSGVCISAGYTSTPNTLLRLCQCSSSQGHTPLYAPSFSKRNLYPLTAELCSLLALIQMCHRPLCCAIVLALGTGLWFAWTIHMRNNPTFGVLRVETASLVSSWAMNRNTPSTPSSPWGIGHCLQERDHSMLRKDPKSGQAELWVTPTVWGRTTWDKLQDLLPVHVSQQVPLPADPDSCFSMRRVVFLSKGHLREWGNYFHNIHDLLLSVFSAARDHGWIDAQKGLSVQLIGPTSMKLNKLVCYHLHFLSLGIFSLQNQCNERVSR